MTNKAKQRARALQKRNPGMSYQAAREENHLSGPVGQDRSSKVRVMRGETTEERVLLRPFDLTDAKVGTKLPIRGKISDGAYIVEVLGFRHAIDAIEVFRDDFGEVAVVAPFAVELPWSLVMTLKAEWDIPVYQDEVVHLEGVLTIAGVRKHDHYPVVHPIFVPAGDEFSVSFDAWGTSNGCGWGWKGPPPPPPAHART